MKLKEALPDFDSTFFDLPQKSNRPPFKPTAAKPVSRKDLEVSVDKMKDGSFRATIKSIRGEPYGTKFDHPKEFMASGRTPEEAEKELFKKLKDLVTEDDSTKTPFARGSQTLEIIVEPSGGAYRALIKTVNGRPYGTNPIHPKEFLASGKTAAEALIALAQKLK